jgi:hypothetical protein
MNARLLAIFIPTVKMRVLAKLCSVNSPPELEARLAEFPVPVRRPGVALGQVSSVRRNLVRNHTLHTDICTQQLQNISECECSIETVAGTMSSMRRNLVRSHTLCTRMTIHSSCSISANASF